MQLRFNFFCRDIEAQLAFYRAVLDLPEATYTRSASYRSLHTPEFQFGFHAAPAHELLGLAGRRPGRAPPRSLAGYPSFLLETPDDVNAIAARAASLGGRVLRGPFATDYGQWQAVIADPEGHVFRVASEDLPDGIAPATPASTAVAH